MPAITASSQTTQQATTMTEPATTAAGTFAGYKLALFSLPVIASLIAFWLGLRFVPLRGTDPRGDLLNRVLACLVSCFVIGVPALVLLMQHMPGVFDAGIRLAALAGLPAIAGFFCITGCVFVLSSIPGPWIVAAVFLWLDRRRNKDIGELVNEVRRGISPRQIIPIDQDHDVQAQDKKAPAMQDERLRY